MMSACVHFWTSRVARPTYVRRTGARVYDRALRPSRVMSDSDRGSQVSCETWLAGTTWWAWLLFFLKSSSEPDIMGRGGGEGGRWEEEEGDGEGCCLEDEIAS